MTPQSVFCPNIGCPARDWIAEARRLTKSTKREVIASHLGRVEAGVAVGGDVDQVFTLDSLQEDWI